MKIISSHPSFNPSTTNKKVVVSTSSTSTSSRSSQHQQHKKKNRRKKSSIDSMLKQEGGTTSNSRMKQEIVSKHTLALPTIEMVCSSSFQQEDENNDLLLLVVPPPQEEEGVTADETNAVLMKEEVEHYGAAAAAACTSNGKKQNRKHLRKKKHESQSVSNETKVSMLVLVEDDPHKVHTHNSNHGHWTSLDKVNANQLDLTLNGKESSSKATISSATSNDIGSNVTENRSMCNKRTTEDCNLCKSRPLSTTTAIHVGKKSNVLHDGTNQGLKISSTTTFTSTTSTEMADHHDVKKPAAGPGIKMESHFFQSNESKSNELTQEVLSAFHDDCVYPYSYYNFDDCSTHDYNYEPAAALSKNSSSEEEQEQQQQEDHHDVVYRPAQAPMMIQPFWWMEYPFVSNYYDYLEPYQQEYHGMYYTEHCVPTIAGIMAGAPPPPLEESTTSCNIVGYEEVNVGGCVYFHPIFE